MAEDLYRGLLKGGYVDSVKILPNLQIKMQITATWSAKCDTLGGGVNAPSTVRVKQDITTTEATSEPALAFRGGGGSEKRHGGVVEPLFRS